MNIEPLAGWDGDGNLVPQLAAEIPSRQNGGLAADGRSVIWMLKRGVMWHDGTPLAEIAVKLRYSVSTLAKLRMLYGWRKRFGEPDGEPPTQDVIRLRALEIQAGWTEEQRRRARVGLGHTIYTAVTGYDAET